MRSTTTESEFVTLKPFKALRRAAMIPALLALGASLTLTACSGAAPGGVSKSATPDEVFKAYVAALNDGNVEAALGMLADPGDMTLENTEWVEEFATEFPEPLLRSELELADEIESTSLHFDFILKDPYSVAFVKVDDAWKLKEPLFFLQSMEESDRERASDRADDITHSTWWEVLEELEITATTAAGTEFTFPEYLAGIAVFPPKNAGSAEPVTANLTLTPLPKSGVLQKTEFSVFELKFEQNRYGLNGIHFASDPIDPQLIKKAADLASQETYVFGEGLSQVEVLPSEINCYSEMFFRNEKGDFSYVYGAYDADITIEVPGAPEVNPRDDYAPRIACEAVFVEPDFGNEEITHFWFNYYPATGEVRPYDNNAMP